MQKKYRTSKKNLKLTLSLMMLKNSQTYTTRFLKHVLQFSTSCLEGLTESEKCNMKKEKGKSRKLVERPQQILGSI